MPFDSFIQEVNLLLSEVRGSELSGEERLYLEAAYKNLKYQIVIDAELARSGIAYEYRRVSAPASLITFFQEVLKVEDQINRYNVVQLLEKFDLAAIRRKCLAQKGNFYGREAESEELIKLCETKRLIVLHGVAGIGKSVLAKRVSESLKKKASILISVYTEPKFNDFLEILYKKLGFPPVKPEFLLDALFQELQSKNYLIIVESAEALFRGIRNTLMESEKGAEYLNFFWQWAERNHSSTLLLASQHPFVDLQAFEFSSLPCLHYELKELDLAACRSIFKEHRLKDEHLWDELARLHLCNPLTLHEIAAAIYQLQHGNVSQWLDFKTLHLSDAQNQFLEYQISGCSKLQLEILTYLCQVDADNKVEFSEIQSTFKKKGISTTATISAIQELHKDSLIKIENSSISIPLLIKKFLKGRGDAG